MKNSLGFSLVLVVLLLIPLLQVAVYVILTPLSLIQADKVYTSV